MVEDCWSKLAVPIQLKNCSATRKSNEHTKFLLKNANWALESKAETFCFATVSLCLIGSIKKPSRNVMTQQASDLYAKRRKMQIPEMPTLPEDLFFENGCVYTSLTSRQGRVRRVVNCHSHSNLQYFRFPTDPLGEDDSVWLSEKTLQEDSERSYIADPNMYDNTSGRSVVEDWNFWSKNTFSENFTMRRNVVELGRTHAKFQRF